MEKILPFDMNVPVQTYNHHANWLGMIYVKNKHTNILNNDYINLKYNEKIICTLNFCMENDYWLNSGIIERRTSLVINENIIEEMIKMIDEEYYISGLCDENLLFNSKIIGKEQFIHDFFIIGYCDNGFLVNGYLENHKYGTITVGYETMYCAISYVMANELTYTKIESIFDTPLQIEKILVLMEEYLSGKPSGKVEPLDLFGMAAIREIISVFKEENIQRIDLRMLRILWEHKRLMNQRIQCIFTQYSIMDKEITSCLQKLEDEFAIIFHLGMKYNITLDRKIIDKVVYTLNESLGIENVCYTKILSKLKVILGD